MKTHLNPDEIAILFSIFRTSNNASHHFTKIVHEFLPLIKHQASNYPYFWEDDFVQEGIVGLYNAARKYPSSAHPSQFLYYAISAIGSKMVDFYRSTIGRSVIELAGFDQDGNITITKEPMFVSKQDILTDDNNGKDVIDKASAQVDYVTSTTLAIDFKYHLSEEKMRRYEFSEREIKSFNLYYQFGYTVSEVAEATDVSVSQASKIVSKAKGKVRKILSP